MHSLKNTVVAVLLLGVSYGVYYVLMTPDPAKVKEDEVAEMFREAEGSDIELPGLETDAPSFPRDPGNRAGDSTGFADRLDVPPINDGLVGGDGGFQPTPPRIEASGGGFSQDPPPIAMATQPPSGRGQLIPDEILQRQPQYDLGGDSSNQLVGGSEPVEPDFDSTEPHDQILIDAIREEVNSGVNVFLPDERPDVPDVAPPANGGTFGGGQFGGSFDGSSTRVHNGPEQPQSSGGQFIENQFVSAAPRTTGPVNAPAVSSPAPRQPSFNPPAVEPLSNSNSFVDSTAPSVAAPAEPAMPPSAEGQKTLTTSWPAVQRMIDEGNFRGALGTLSRFYTDPTLTPAENDQLMEWLDSLAGKVIYSPEHNLFRNAYTVKAGETINDLAARWKVTPQLIYNVNRSMIDNPTELLPGTELKMLSGPFHAEVNLDKNIMTLFVSNLYAGRFQIQFAQAPDLQPGAYSVANKSRDPAGESWTIVLDNGACIRTLVPGEQLPADCIGLHPDDSDDVFGILTDNSRIFVR
ncbi:MAG: LysM domain-containing protein [Planctomycetota bacterium]